MKKTYNLKTKFTFIITTIILIFLIIVISIIRSIVMRQIERELVDSISKEQIQMDIGNTYLLNSISPIHISIESKLAQYGLDDMSDHDIEIAYRKIMKEVIYDYDLFYDILYYHNEKIYYQANDLNSLTFTNKEFIDEAKNSEKILTIGPIIKIGNYNNILIGKKINANPKLENSIVIYMLKLERIQKILEMNNIQKNDTFLIYKKRIIASSNENTVGSLIFDDKIMIPNNNYKITTINHKKTIIVSTQAINTNSQYDLDFNYVTLLDYDELATDINKLNRNIIVISIIVGIVGIVLALRISIGLSKPIYNLQQKMKEYKEKEENNKIELSSNDEIVELENSFNEMINRISNLIEENEIQFENKRKLELYALQMQINPHFLYNTLDAIAWLAKLKHQHEIEQLVMALAQFFRISLHKGDKFIKVEEEIELIKNYIAIEQIRFPEKFEVEYDIEEEVKSLETMKLILQPLVENAIKHGISAVEYGKITVKAYKNDDYIYYEVIDNGVGFDFTKTDSHIRQMSGYGIKNVDERIKLEYGNESGVTIFSQLNKGTKVLVKFKIK